MFYSEVCVHREAHSSLQFFVTYFTYFFCHSVLLFPFFSAVISVVFFFALPRAARKIVLFLVCSMAYSSWPLPTIC